MTVLDKEIEAQGRKVKWLAENLGVTRQTIHNWRKGKTLPSYDRMVALSRLLDRPVESLFPPEK